MFLTAKHLNSNQTKHEHKNIRIIVLVEKICQKNQSSNKNTAIVPQARLQKFFKHDIKVKIQTSIKKYTVSADRKDQYDDVETIYTKGNNAYKYV